MKILHLSLLIVPALLLHANEAPDYDDTIRTQMRERWSTPVRQTWEIEHRKVAGLAGPSAWHIKGTMWRVRIYPSAYKLDELDKTKTYAIDAVALDQNYGTIDFYIHGFPKPNKDRPRAEPDR